VREPVPGLDQLVAGLVQARIAVRELRGRSVPLETAFLALTEARNPAQAKSPPVTARLCSDRRRAGPPGPSQ